MPTLISLFSTGHALPPVHADTRKSLSAVRAQQTRGLMDSPGLHVLVERVGGVGLVRHPYCRQDDRHKDNLAVPIVQRGRVVPAVAVQRHVRRNIDAAFAAGPADRSSSSW